RLYYKENKYNDIGALSVLRFVEMDLGDVEIKREYRNIDMLVLSKSNQLAIAIENKIDSFEGDGQLEKYTRLIREEFDEYKYSIFFYLSLSGEELSDTSHDFVPVRYDDIYSIIETFLMQKPLMVADTVEFVLNQYLLTLRT